MAQLQSTSITGSLTVSGSLIALNGLTGTADTASYVDYSNVANKPTLVSGSSQINAQSAQSPSAIYDNGGTPTLRSGITQAEMRTAIGVDPAGTDNSTDVTLAGSYDYITISGQVITRGQVDASTDISNLTTTNVSEGTNQYYTDARVKTKLNTETVVSSSGQILTLVSIDEDSMTSNSDTKLPTQQSVKSYVDTKVANLVDSAPGALDTLNELAAALGDDASFSTTVSNTIAGKVSQSLQIISGNGLTGGGNLTTNRTLAVGQGDGISVTADAVAVDATVLRTTGDNIVSGSSQINHDSTTGFVANEHIDHSSVSITAGTGLTGGGTIASSRTISLSHLGIQNLTDPNADRIIFWDDSAGATAWLTLGSNLSISGTTINATDTNTTYSAGSGITLSGTTFSHTDTSTQASVNNSGRTFIQDITLDDYGHVTAITSATDADTYVGTVTSVTVSGSNGLTGSGTVTSTGTVNIQHADTSTQSSVNNSGRTFIQDITLDGYGHVTAITSATDSDTYVGTVTSVATGTGLTGGTITSTGTISLSHLGIQNLTDPNADRILFWDDSAGATAWLTAGTNITISGTTISATDTNTTYSAGNGITLSGTTFSVAAGGGLTQDAGGLSHTDTSTQASVNNSNGTVIQDITLDTYGHVTAISSYNLDGRYFTETEADARFLGISAKAADSDLLDGENGIYYLGGRGTSNNYVSSSASTSDRGNFGQGVWAYSGYSTGTNRPFTYDATLQVMPNSALGFEIAADWISQTSTPLKVRSLRDCCQGWSTWSTIWTSTTDGAGSGLDADLLDGQEGSYYRNASNINAGTIGDAYLPATISSDITGNAATATKLATARTIGGVSFDGSANINLPGVNTAGNQNTSGNAATATKWATARTITLGGDLTGNVSIDGSANATLTATIAANSVALGTDTTGNYVGTITAGTGIDTTGATTGEGIAHTISVDVSDFMTNGSNNRVVTATGTDGMNAEANLTFDGSTLTVAGDVSIADKIIHTGDTNTAIRFPAADTFTVETAGSERMRITSAGNVGIGTTTPGSKLEVYGSGSTVLDIQGSTGQLFSVTDSLTGTLMSVNDISGLPILEVTSDDGVTMGTFGSPAITVSGSSAQVTGSLSGNATTATTLQTARTIGGVSFDGSANINLPGVNTAGNQNTSGNAATATKLATARTIGGVSFDGSANINLPGVNTAGNQSTSGNAATATKLATARTIGGISFDGSANINLPGVNITGNQNTSGNAATATILNTHTGTNNGGLQYWQLVNNSTLNPDTNYWYALRMAHGNADTYYSATLAVDFFSDTIKLRRKVNNVDQSWITLLHSTNYNSYSPTLTGTGASGTWGISVTGNAATATKWATARTITLGGDLTGNVSIDGSANATLTATIAANSVALGTDTTGNYVGTITAGTGIDTTGATTGEGIAHTISVDVSDFMTNGSNNRIVTATGTDGMNAEANLTFDGSTLNITGNITPSANATYNLGSSSNRWNVVYTSDLSLKNEHGDWTIVEGEDDLFLYNNKKGKVYKFNLTEVQPSEAPPKRN